MIFKPDEYISIAQNFRMSYSPWELVNMLEYGKNLLRWKLTQELQVCLYLLSLDNQV